VAMDFGIFMEFEIRQGGDQASAFREGFDVVDSAEAWGLDGVWLGEMHFTPARSVLAAPIVVASSIATRTKRLRIGMAVQVLPLNNPLRIAEEAATVDHISEGRFDFGIGRSGFPRVYDLYGVPYAESQERFREPLSAPAPAAPDGRHDRGNVPPGRPDGATHLRRPARDGHPRSEDSHPNLPPGMA
jgi:alkanesulfonate monooxygenase SsuD/methylene tetrahydromethanopterin reductase-like flavin-dependent oxidoreductase (luciferase family)